MCRSYADGVRRCASHSSRAYLDAHNRRRKAARARRRAVAAWFTEHMGPEMGAAAMATSPGQVVAFAQMMGCPDRVWHPAATTFDIPHRVRVTGNPGDYGFDPPDVDRDSLDPDDVDELRAASAEVLATLSPAEREALVHYTAGEPVVNQLLRDGVPLNQDGEEFDRIRLLDDVLNRVPPSPYPVTVYRGTRTPDGSNGRVDEWIDGAYPDGTVVDFPAYVSTSHDPTVATEFAGHDECVMIFELSTVDGVDVSAVSEHPEEAERILPRGTRWRVVGRSRGVRFPGAESFGAGASYTVVHLVPDSMVAEDSSGTAPARSFRLAEEAS